MEIYHESSVKYPCKRWQLSSPKRQDKFETNQQIKRKQKEQRHEIHELLYRTEVGSGAHEC